MVDIEKVSSSSGHANTSEEENSTKEVDLIEYQNRNAGWLVVTPEFVAQLCFLFIDPCSYTLPVIEKRQSSLGQNLPQNLSIALTVPKFSGLSLPMIPMTLKTYVFAFPLAGSSI